MRNSSTAGCTTIGNWWRPNLATASAIVVTALSSWMNDPCPALPRAFRRIHNMPFSAVSIRYSLRSPPSRRGTVSEKPPTSPTASVMPSKRSGRFSTSHLAPYFPPASSSATKANTRSRGGTMPARLKCRATAIIIPHMSFMSTAPRPHT